MVIKAKSTGTFAGIAIAQHPDYIPSPQPHTITGGGTININGIAYFPTQPLKITGGGTIGNDADQFAILADTIEINGNGMLEIRIGADYTAAGLPELPEASETAHPEIPDQPIILELQELVVSGHVKIDNTG